MRRLWVSVAIAAASLACGVNPCPLFRCQVLTRVDVVDEQNNAVTRFSGLAFVGETTIAFGCGGEPRPDAGTVEVAECDGSRLELPAQGELTLQLDSPSGSFNGLVTTAFVPPEKDAQGCDRDCGHALGRVILR